MFLPLVERVEARPHDLFEKLGIVPLVRLGAVTRDEVRELAAELIAGPLSIAAVGAVQPDTFTKLDVEPTAA